LSAILEARGTPTLINESGSNLFRGVGSALAFAPPEARAGVFEVDEGALGRVVPVLRPRVLVLTNVFRDQLDRFGEPETVARLLDESGRALPEGSTVVANADDPLLWHAVRDLGAVGFGVRATAVTGGARNDAEPEVCPSCGDALAYRRRTISHLGAATCPRCGWSNDDAAFLADVETRSGLDSLSMTVAGARCELRLGGIHNAYNAAAAIAAAASLGVLPA